MTTTATKRRCAGKACGGVPLSIYNSDPDGLCGPCRKTQTDGWVAALREQMDQGLAPQQNVPETRPSTTTWRILRAMPGTASQIAERTGLDIDKVRTFARDVCHDGRAERQAIARTGGQGERTVYVCLVELPEPTGAAGTRKYTRESLIETLHDMRRILDRVPVATDCGSPWPSRSSFDRYFTTWADALEAAGMRARSKPREEYLSALSVAPATSSELAARFGRNVNATTSTLFDLYQHGTVNREWQPKTRRYLYSLNTKGEA